MDHEPEPPEPENKMAPAGKQALPSAFNLFVPSWQAVKVNLATLLLLQVIPGMVGLLALLTYGDLSVHHKPLAITLGLILGFITFILAVVSTPASTYVQLRSINNEKIDYWEAMLIGKNYALRFFLLNIITTILVVAGFIMLVVPGVIFLRRYFLATYVLVDQNTGIFESLRNSAAISKGHMMAIWGVLGVMILISVPELIPYIGTLVTLILAIMYLCAPAMRYVQLKVLSADKSKA